MGTLNYSTTVPMARTVGEIQDILARAGADAVGTRYENRRPAGVSFMLNTAAGVASFTLPVNVDAVHKLLVQQHAAGQLGRQVSKAVLTSREHAERVAWRVAKDWLVAQRDWRSTATRGSPSSPWVTHRSARRARGTGWWKNRTGRCWT